MGRSTTDACANDRPASSAQSPRASHPARAPSRRRRSRRRRPVEHSPDGAAVVVGQLGGLDQPDVGHGVNPATTGAAVSLRAAERNQDARVDAFGADRLGQAVGCDRPQVGQLERSLPVAAVQRADEGEERRVLRDREQLPGGGDAEAAYPADRVVSPIAQSRPRAAEATLVSVPNSALCPRRVGPWPPSPAFAPAQATRAAPGAAGSPRRNDSWA